MNQVSNLSKINICFRKRIFSKSQRTSEGKFLKFKSKKIHDITLGNKSAHIPDLAKLKPAKLAELEQLFQGKSGYFFFPLL
jgi:hypothetical protein